MTTHKIGKQPAWDTLSRAERLLYSRGVLFDASNRKRLELLALGTLGGAIARRVNNNKISRTKLESLIDRIQAARLLQIPDDPDMCRLGLDKIDPFVLNMFLKPLQNFLAETKSAAFSILWPN